MPPGAQAGEGAVTPPDFADEFLGLNGVVNSQRWGFDLPWSRGRPTWCRAGELQCYEPTQAKVWNGYLFLIAQEALFPRDPAHPYKSGLIQSHPDPEAGRVGYATRYGYFAIRAKLPAAQGAWPAFWLLPTDLSWPPELDVFEAWGPTPDVHHCNVHWDGGDGPQHAGGPFHVGPDKSAGFHTYAMRWTQGRVQCIFDGEVWNTFRTHVPQKRMYLIANLAVGGMAGRPDPADFPAWLTVDWIRAWDKPCRC